MKTSLVRAIGGCFALAALVASAVAQGLPSASHLTLTQRSAFLLTNRDVSSKLGLTATQQKAVTTAVTSLSKTQDQLMAAKDPSEADMHKADRVFAQTALGALSAPQKQKLTAITIRRVGAAALLDAEIAKKVGVTAAQSKTITALLRAVQKREDAVDDGMADTLARLPDAKTDEARIAAHNAVVQSYEPEREKLAKQRAAADAKVITLLSVAQKKRWLALAS